MEEMRAKRSLMPKTPFKNSLDKPPVFRPYRGQEGKKPDQAIRDHLMKTSIASHSIGACTVSTMMEEASRFNVPFKTLLAIAESGSGSRNGATLGRTQLLHSIPTNYDHRPVFDLNFSHESMEEAFYRNSTSRFAPLTPEKPVMRDHSEDAKRQSFCLNDRPNEELYQQERESTAAEVLANMLQNDKLSQNSATDLNLAATSPQSENHYPIKGGYAENLIKTPQQNPRKKKHRPKLITDGKPRPQKQVVEKPAESKEKPSGKRKYVRKNASNKTLRTPIAEVTGEATYQTMPELAKRPCRRSFNFDGDEEPKDDSINRTPRTEQESQDKAEVNQSKSAVHLSEGTDVLVNSAQRGIVQLIQDYSSPTENQVAGTQTKVTDIPPERGHVYTFKPKHRENVPCEHLMHMKSQTNSKLRPILPKGFKCCSGTIFRTEQAAKDPKRMYSASIQQSNIVSANSVGTNYNSLSAYNNRECGGQSQKRKRTEKGRAGSAQLNTRAAQPVGNSHGHQHFVKDLAKLMCYTFGRENMTKNQGSLFNFAPSSRFEEHPSGKILYKQDNFSSKTSEQNALVPYSFANEQNALVLYRQDRTLVPYYGTFTPVKNKSPRARVDLDDETNRVWKLLMGNINSEGIDGTDPETAKQWEEDRNVFHGRAESFIARMHLVQGDRRFSPWKGSVLDSVIGVFLTQNVSDHLSSSAFMSLAALFPVNPNRKLKPCLDGDTSSVIDKPILCILDSETAKSNETSNHSISDQSSMSLQCTELDEEKETFNGEEMSRSSTGIINTQDSTETSSESIKNISSMEVTEMGQTYLAGEKKEANDMSSCQSSTVSSQKSIDTQINQAAEKEESFSENNLQTIDRIGHMKGSFLELLQKAETATLHDYSMGNANFASNLNFQNRCKYTQNMENVLQSQQMKTLDCFRSCSEGSGLPCNDCHVHSSVFVVEEIEDVQIIPEEARYSCISEDKGINVMKDYTTSTEESASHYSYQNKLNITVQEVSRSPFVHDPSFNSALKGSSVTMEAGTSQMGDPIIVSDSLSQVHNSELPQNVLFSNLALDVMETSSEFNEQGKNSSKISSQSKGKELQDMEAAKRKAKIRRVGNDIRENVDWDALKRVTEEKRGKRERTADTIDSVDWEAVRLANVEELAETIKERGMNNILAGRIKEFLERMVREHGNIDLEWLRDIEPDAAKEYLLTVRGLGLKSVECVRLLTLHHLAFPVDTNVARIAVRLGWVPLQPLPESLQLHLLELYPVMESIQKYLWPRLCKLDQKTLYEFHYQLITFGKVFCTKGKPNCNACPMRGECRHFASAFASARLSLPAPEEKGIVRRTENRTEHYTPMVVSPLSLPPPVENQQLIDNKNPEANQLLDIQFKVSNCNPIIEEPSSPEPEHTTEVEDIEDMCLDDPDEIPTIKLNIEKFSQNLQDYMQNNMELQEVDMSKALVALTAGAASIPTPKLKNVSRLRTEHHVYELPDSHPLLQELDTRQTDDLSPYLLAIWTPGETADSIQPPEGNCHAQGYGKLCDEKTCCSCNSIREANSQIFRGTLLIPCRTAMRGSFPLNGTYFQVNEVFADHDSSLRPIDVPRSWIWNLPRRTVYFGTSVPSIFRGLTTEEIQHCFWRGYVCVRGFDQNTRAPRPLMARLHFPVSKLTKNKEKM